MRHSSTPAQPSPGGVTQGQNWAHRLTGTWAAAAVLFLFWALMVASLRDKSLTYDEVAHAAAGYSYWHFDDFRLQPENGQLPQRIAGLPMALSIAPFPAPEASAWRDADDWRLGYQWLFKSGMDAGDLAGEGRMGCGLFAVALGAVVWAWSRSLFGRVGAMVSLLLFVLSPTILANGALMTSDTAAALFFAASTLAAWALFERLSLARVALSSVLMAGLFLTKVSALLIGPVILLLAGARLLNGRPLTLVIGPFRKELCGRSHQALAFVAAFGVHAAVVVALIWASYSFRYSAFANPGDSGGRFRQPWEYLLAKPGPAPVLAALGLDAAQKQHVQAILLTQGATEAIWTNRSLDALSQIRRDVLSPGQIQRLDEILKHPSPELWVRLVEGARKHRLLPEAWIYGFADVYRRSQVRPAFLNGEFRLRGWPSFFPYTFLVKTPLAMFGVIALALAAFAERRIRSARNQIRDTWACVYPTLPLWALMAVYWAAAIGSHLNIGHRHLLPIYAPLCVLCGAAGAWVASGLPSGRQGKMGPAPWAIRTAAASLTLLIVLLAVDVTRSFPNYLAYFNGLVGPRDAYRHLVDSSLDWGQDLPAVRSYLDRHSDEKEPSYFSYFGTSSPSYYGIRARPLFSVAGADGFGKPDWENLFISPDDLASHIESLRQEWKDYDLLGVQRLGETVAVTFLRKPELLGLHPGTYLISASMLQPVNFNLQGPWGPWNSRYEATYQELYASVKPLMGDDRKARIAALVRHRTGDWPELLNRFEEYRFGRLTAFLRTRNPDNEINFSVLVYHLTDEDLRHAFEGPPPELGFDARASELAKLPKSAADALP